MRCAPRVSGLASGRRWSSIVAAGLLGGCAWVGWMVAAREDPNLRFQHAVHVAQLGMRCDECHVLSGGGERSGPPPAGDDAHYPRAAHDRCVRCHVPAKSGEAHAAKCTACHAEPFSAGALADARRHADVYAREVRFDHRAHVSLECARCHGDVATATGRGPAHFPRMESCLQCHSADSTAEAPAPGGCVTCHRTMARTFVPPTHTLTFRRRHGADARAADATCARCHRGNDCDACHRAERPADHTLRFERARHGLAATIDRERCAVCHEADQCSACHAQPPSNHTSAFMMRGPPAQQDGSRHGRDARRRPTACTACHEYASTCAKCH